MDRVSSAKALALSKEISVIPLNLGENSNPADCILLD
jgi:hypothetical protein